VNELIVFTNGCFDILHRGHFELLKFCNSFGQVTVGLNSDNSVKKLKGSGRPVNNFEDRKFALESCKYVAKVIGFDEETPYRLIQEIQPDLIVKGGDYKIEDVVGGDMAEVKIFKLVQGKSTSSLLSQIRKLG
jgi:D-beta-D-heptose 7-phosphate kinase / D-beta-D-heptose 1-phosphate adenosyltransferase